MEQKPTMQQSQAEGRPSSKIVVHREQIPLNERLIAATAMVGGGLLGGKLAADWLSDVSTADILREGSWEKPVNSVKMNVVNPDGTSSFAAAQANKAAATQRVSLQEEKGAKLLSAKDWKSLKSLNQLGAGDCVVYTRTGANKLNAVLHTRQAGVITVPNISASKVTGVQLPAKAGEAVTVKDHSHILKMLSNPSGYIKEAVTNRVNALDKELHGSMLKVYTNRFKEMSGVNKFNVVSMAVVGVVAGTFAATGINALIRGGSHAAGVVAGRDDQANIAGNAR